MRISTGKLAQALKEDFPTITPNWILMGIETGEIPVYPTNPFSSKPVYAIREEPLHDILINFFKLTEDRAWEVLKKLGVNFKGHLLKLVS